MLIKYISKPPDGVSYDTFMNETNEHVAVPASRGTCIFYKGFIGSDKGMPPLFYGNGCAINRTTRRRGRRIGRKRHVKIPKPRWKIYLPCEVCRKQDNAVNVW